MSSHGSSPGPIRSFGSAPAYRPNLASPQSRPSYSSPIGPAPFGGTQPVQSRRYPHVYNGNRPYYYSSSTYLVPGYLGYGYYGSSDDSSNAAGYADQPQAAPGYADASSQAQPADAGYEQSSARQPYDPQTAATVNQPSGPPEDQPLITLIFKDGRPAQQVQNYAVTRSTVYVFDGAKRREIPLNDIDLPQTEKANRDAGLDFEIPAGVE